MCISKALIQRRMFHPMECLKSYKTMPGGSFLSNAILFYSQPVHEEKATVVSTTQVLDNESLTLCSIARYVCIPGTDTSTAASTPHTSPKTKFPTTGKSIPTATPFIHTLATTPSSRTIPRTTTIKTTPSTVAMSSRITTKLSPVPTTASRQATSS